MIPGFVPDPSGEREESVERCILEFRQREQGFRSSPAKGEFLGLHRCFGLFDESWADLGFLSRVSLKELSSPFGSRKQDLAQRNYRRSIFSYLMDLGSTVKEGWCRAC